MPNISNKLQARMVGRCRRGVTVNPYSRTKRQGGKPRETREVNVTPESNTRHNHVDKVVETKHATRASANNIFAKWFIRLLRHSRSPSAASPATSAVTGIPTITPATPGQLQWPGGPSQVPLPPVQTLLEINSERDRNFGITRDPWKKVRTKEPKGLLVDESRTRLEMCGMSQLTQPYNHVFVKMGMDFVVCRRMLADY
ncbi:hypothetical protein BGW80DRAFT_1253854 [Lactifluus volemus]|nr:hypothetical protein BGW80DRAFT_1253854 [Lactifluus volemus]